MKHSVVEYVLVVAVATAAIFLVVAGMGIGVEALTRHVHTLVSGGLK